MPVNTVDQSATLPVGDLLHHGSTAKADLTRLRHNLSDWASQAGMTERQANAVAQASYEAMANVKAHAYDGKSGLLDIHATCTREGKVTVTIADQGRWRPMTRQLHPSREHGLLIIQGFAPQAHITTTQDGTTVRLNWQILHLVPTDGQDSRTQDLKARILFRQIAGGSTQQRRPGRTWTPIAPRSIDCCASQRRTPPPSTGRS
ncbi:ATP-binding protein [Fodinicola feengrottensis]|uniref:ATP-binding protein n=1 Tax=Fodinicola feengrottensis TaxID=435914 RepID=UPI0036F4334D